jgi:hypothetical protein
MEPSVPYHNTTSPVQPHHLIPKSIPAWVPKPSTLGSPGLGHWGCMAWRLWTPDKWTCEKLSKVPLQRLQIIHINQGLKFHLQSTQPGAGKAGSDSCDPEMTGQDRGQSQEHAIRKPTPARADGSSFPSWLLVAVQCLQRAQGPLLCLCSLYASCPGPASLFSAPHLPVCPQRTQPFPHTHVSVKMEA